MSYVAVDIGATNTRIAIGDVSGIKLKLSEVTDRYHGPEGVPKQISKMIRATKVDPISIGIGSIGPLDIHRGVIGQTPNFSFKNIPITEPLSDDFGIDVKIMNDCNAAVIGEHVYGAGKGLENLFYVTISTGLGGGAIVDGHPLGGKDGNAPEIGHLVINHKSELTCGCGCIGHWEAYCSGANIPNYAQLLLKGRDLSESALTSLAGKDLKNLSSEMIFEAARKGDPCAQEVINEVGVINAVGFANIVNAFDPELITVGGSVALRNHEMIIDPIQMNIDAHLINRKPRIMITPLGEDVVLYGALAVAQQIKV